MAEAIHTVAPWGVDVASGVEASPGRKDPVKLRRFIANAIAAFEELPEPDEFAPDVVDRDDLGDSADLDLDALANDWITAEPADPENTPFFDWKDDPLWK